MKYGIVATQEWRDPEANTGFPEESFCIVFLTDAGIVAPDELAQNESGVEMGAGQVYSLGDAQWQPGEMLGYVPLPMDIAYFGLFDTAVEAVDHMLLRPRNETRRIEDSVNSEMLLNRYIDETIMYQRRRRNAMEYVWMVVALIVFLLILAGVVFIMRYYGYLPARGAL